MHCLFAVKDDSWATLPSHIALAWRGAPLGDYHARMLDALEAVA